jgi:hypothetical protein
MMFAAPHQAIIQFMSQLCASARQIPPCLHLIIRDTVWWMNGIYTTRFAPSTTGHAHPGTLLSALLTWLSARSVGGRVVLRLENLDPQRCLPEYNQSMIDELAWFGLDWDEVVWQDQRRSEHEQALGCVGGSRIALPVFVQSRPA